MRRLRLFSRRLDAPSVLYGSTATGCLIAFGEGRWVTAVVLGAAAVTLWAGLADSLLDRMRRR